MKKMILSYLILFVLQSLLNNSVYCQKKQKKPKDTAKKYKKENFRACRILRNGLLGSNKDFSAESYTLFQRVLFRKHTNPLKVKNIVDRGSKKFSHVEGQEKGSYTTTYFVALTYEKFLNYYIFKSDPTIDELSLKEHLDSALYFLERAKRDFPINTQNPSIKDDFKKHFIDADIMGDLEKCLKKELLFLKEREIDTLLHIVDLYKTLKNEKTDTSRNNENKKISFPAIPDQNNPNTPETKIISNDTSVKLIFDPSEIAKFPLPISKDSIGIQGMILDSKGNPIPKAKITFSDITGTEITNVFSDAKGKYSGILPENSSIIITVAGNIKNSSGQILLYISFVSIDVPKKTENPFLLGKNINAYQFPSEFNDTNNLLMPPILFDKDQYSPKDATAAGKILRLAKSFQSEEKSKKTKILIHGYADEIGGSMDYNLKLSQKRANIVLNYLKQGCPECYFIAEGMGQTNKISDDYNKNRAVLIFPAN